MSTNENQNISKSKQKRAERIKKNERVMIVTLTIKMAEELSKYLKELGLNVAYLHSEFKTFEDCKLEKMNETDKKACEILRMGAGTQWDADLVRHFISKIFRTKRR